MAELLTNKDNLFKYGYCLVRNLLDNEEVQKIRSIIKKAKEKSGNIGNPVSEHRESWEIVFSDRILNAVRSVLGPNIFYLHDGTINQWGVNDDNTEFSSWHRDNPCRLFGKGPDWDKNEPYNVVRIIIYLSLNEETNSGINLIPFTHSKRFTLSNILRVLHFRIKKITFLKGIRKLFLIFLGVNVRTDPGDCVMFLANLCHKALSHRSLRDSIICAFGIDNKHSKNYVNYILKLI